MRVRIRSQQGETSPQVSFSVENESEIDMLTSALTTGHNWVRINEQGVLEVCSAHDAPPRVPDPPIDECWKYARADQENLVLRHAPDELRQVNDSPAFYVWHIAGYSGNYEVRAKRLLEAGFVPMRSPRGRDGKIWEAWYLPGAWAGEGPIEGKSWQDVESWVLHEIRPGNLVLTGRAWGLGVD